MMTRVLIIGAGGMLGHKLCQWLPTDGWDVTATARKDAAFYARYPGVFDRVRLLGGVDVLNEVSLETAIRAADPQFVINCVGIIKQLAEAHNRYLSVGINSWLPHRLAKLCHQQGRRLIHISTDCVFDGVRGQYRESDPTNATDLYGQSKALGETDAHETAAVTLRTSIIGRELEPPGHGLIDWFLGQRGRTIRGFANAIYTGFTTQEIARAIVRVMRHPQPLCGLYQVASQPINKYDLLCLAREAFGIDVEIQRDETFRCERSMIMDRFTQETGYVAPSWNSMIQELAADQCRHAQIAAA